MSQVTAFVFKTPLLVRIVMPTEAKKLPHGFPIAANPHYKEEELGNLTYTLDHPLENEISGFRFFGGFFKKKTKCQATCPPPSDWRFRILAPSNDNLLKEDVISLATA